MNYQFPYIEDITNVLDAIAGRDEFVVARRENYTVINYHMITTDTFGPVVDYNSAVRRECRGLIFDRDGAVLSRRYHKFFNLNERFETLHENVDFCDQHVILEKLDGSMVTPLVFANDHVRWATKMGITETSMNAEVFVAMHPKYVSFALFAHHNGITPIFEWCSRKNRIVVDYPNDRLVLTAMRHNRSGDYLDYVTIVRFADVYNIDVVNAYDGNGKNIVDALANSRDEEGRVIRFDSGHMVKVKTQWYIDLHRTKDDIRYERNVASIVVNDRVDDLAAFLDRDQFAVLCDYRDNVFADIRDGAARVNDLIINIINNHTTRKEFALNVTTDKWIRQIIFANWNSLSSLNMVAIEDLIVKIIDDHCNNNTQFEQLRASGNAILTERSQWKGLQHNGE
jgi:RNA ligase